MLSQLFQLARSKEREHKNWNWNTEDAMNAIHQGDWVIAIQSTAARSGRSSLLRIICGGPCTICDEEFGPIDF